MKTSEHYIMNRPEKLAWITLAICVFSIMGFLATIPLAGLNAAPGMFGFMGFTGLVPWLFRREGLPDERDRRIINRAQRIGFFIFWLVFVTLSMGIWSWNIMRGTDTISVYVLPLTVFICWALLFTIQSTVTIILYRRGVIDENE